MYRHQKLTVICIAGLAGCSGAALADAPTLSEVLDASGIAVDGYIAASYFHSSETNAFHKYDQHHDSFLLDQAALSVAYQPEQGFGGVVDVVAGENIRFQNFFENGDRSSVGVLQAYAQYATGDLTVIAGKFTSLAGAEVFAPTGNANFSRSLLFVFQPTTHTGVRASYKVSDHLTVIAGINNGWDTTASNYGSKTGELGVSFTPSPKLDLRAQAYVGKDPTFQAQRELYDLVATYNASDWLTFVLNYDWGKQHESVLFGTPDERWEGVAGYANMKLNDQWRVSLRVERFKDKDGVFTSVFTLAEQTIKEQTLTLGYAPSEHFELRLEARLDKASNATILEYHSNPFAEFFTDSQSELALQGVYKF